MIVDIDASKGFIDLWVHFFVVIEDNHFDGKGVFWFRLNSNMFNISLAMVIFSNQNKSQGRVGTLIFAVFR